MATNQDLPATDSAAVLHKLVGDDATAAFENDPKFMDSDPTASASSENLQTRSDRSDLQQQPDLKVSPADEEEEDEDEDDEDEDEDVDDEDDEDEDDEDEELDDDDDDEDLDDEDDEDDDDEDEDA